MQRLLEGHGMTRRERNQLIRTTMDVFRVFRYLFVLVPFMGCPSFALRLFPNMLPSTFQEKYQKKKNEDRIASTVGSGWFFPGHLA